jgi:hypothetical protein
MSERWAKDGRRIYTGAIQEPYRNHTGAIQEPWRKGGWFIGDSYGFTGACTPVNGRLPWMPKDNEKHKMRNYSRYKQDATFHISPIYLYLFNIFIIQRAFSKAFKLFV